MGPLRLAPSLLLAFVLGFGLALGSDAPAHRRIVAADAPPRPGAPFTPGVMAGDVLFLSGNIGVDPRTGKLATTFPEQAAQALRNQQALLEAAGLGWEDAVKVNVYVEDIARYEEFNQLYTRTLPPPFPARTFLAVADLPAGGQIEIEVVAVRRR
jgi:2-iminobutanoate/2-iminopropanoate deaminase